MTPRPLLVYFAIAIGTTSAIAILTASIGWTVTSPAWTLLVPIAMWAAALASLVARRSERPWFTAGMRLGCWGITGAQVFLVPLAMPLVVYGASYAIAWNAGLAQWNPGNGAGMYLCMRWRGHTWETFAREALAPETIRDNSYRAAAAMSG